VSLVDVLGVIGSASATGAFAFATVAVLLGRHHDLGYWLSLGTVYGGAAAIGALLAQRLEF
jgi:hypothetical protein